MQLFAFIQPSEFLHAVNKSEFATRTSDHFYAEWTVTAFRLIRVANHENTHPRVTPTRVRILEAKRIGSWFHRVGRDSDCAILPATISKKERSTKRATVNPTIWQTHAAKARRGFPACTCPTEKPVAAQAQHLAASSAFSRPHHEHVFIHSRCTKILQCPL